jgi:hypothetical protein
MELQLLGGRGGFTETEAKCLSCCRRYIAFWL